MSKLLYDVQVTVVDVLEQGEGEQELVAEADDGRLLHPVQDVHTVFELMQGFAEKQVF